MWHAFIILYGHSWGTVWSLRQMHQPVSGDISTVKIPLVGLTQAAHNGSCYMRLFEQRAKPSFSDKGIKCFACVCVEQKLCRTRTALQRGRLRQAKRMKGCQNKTQCTQILEQYSEARSPLRAIIPLLCGLCVLLCVCVCVTVF